MCRFSAASRDAVHRLCPIVQALEDRLVLSTLTGADIGSPGLPGSSAFDATTGTWTVTGGGADIFGTADQFHYAYQTLVGNGAIVARVTGVQNTHAFAKAGVMIRESLAAGSRHATVDVTPSNGVEFVRRTATGASSASNFHSGVAAPYWVRLKRQGDTFTAYDSADGATWNQVGADSIPMAQTVYAGLAVTSHDNAQVNTSTFTDVSVQPLGYVPLAPTTATLWTTGFFAPTATVDLQAGAAAAPNIAAGEASTYPAVRVNSVGLPLLESRPNGAGLELFLDFAFDNGYYHWFSTDGDRSTFNFFEQRDIFNAWRDVASAFSFLDINVTTVLPTNNHNFGWIAISNEFVWGGEASQPGIGQGRSGLAHHTFALEGRLPALIHELGHELGFWHNSDYDYFGNKVREYTNSYDWLNRTFMGSPYQGVSNKYRFYLSRTAEAAWATQDQIASALFHIRSNVGGDGFRPDDYGNDFGTAFDLGDGTGAIRRDAYIERPSDNDVFKITPTTTGRWEFSANPLYLSTARPVVHLEDSSGRILADSQAYGSGSASFSVNFTADLTAGQTYYVRVFWDGDYSSLGYYNLSVSPLPTNFKHHHHRQPGPARQRRLEPGDGHLHPDRRRHRHLAESGPGAAHLRHAQRRRPDHRAHRRPGQHRHLHQGRHRDPPGPLDRLPARLHRPQARRVARCDRAQRLPDQRVQPVPQLHGHFRAMAVAPHRTL